MTEHVIVYTFTLPNGTQEEFRLRIHPKTLELMGNVPEKLPGWTKLEFNKCPHCPLQEDSHPHCPLAANLVNIVGKLDGVISYEEVGVKVEIEGRQIAQQTTAQRAIGSVLGLVSATSGCPHTAYFRPMARFHLPFAGREETIYRAAGMYLLAQYFRQRSGVPVTFEFSGLEEIYRNIQTVNNYLVKRLHTAVSTDSTVNAIVVLDVYAKTMEVVIKDALEAIRYCFDAYLEPPDPAAGGTRR